MIILKSKAERYQLGSVSTGNLIYRPLNNKGTRGMM